MKGGEGLYVPAKWQASEAIEIDRFRQIFMLPLAFHRSEFEDNDDLRAPVERLLASLKESKNGWVAEDDLSKHCDGLSTSQLMPHYRDKLGRKLDPKGKMKREQREALITRHAHQPDTFEALSEATQAYGEQVYFHDFLRETFYSNEATGIDKEVNLFRREGEHRIRFSVNHWKTGGFAVVARLDRINLYVFSSGAAVLVLEADFGVSPQVTPTGALAKRAMTFADALVITDHLRRVYPPYFSIELSQSKDNWDLQTSAGRVPSDVRIERRETTGNWHLLTLPFGWQPEDISDFETADANLRKRNKSAPPVFDHIRALAAPLRIAGTPEGEETLPGLAPVMRQVVDERMPLMTFITFTGGSTDQDSLYQISRGDWMRLCYADEPGNDLLPYSAHFMENFEADCCYDRYFPHPSTSTSLRIMTCGYHFVVAGAGGYANETIQHHFRRHYFQIGLACHMEIAAMLATSSRVTEAVKRLNDQRDTSAARQRFEATMQSIERDFLKYVHIFHFTGMSNQIQPNEMLDTWQKQLGTKVLFDDLKNEIDTANQFLVAVDQAQDSDASMRLNIIATIGLVLSLAIAFLSMNILGTVPDVQSSGGGSVLPLADPRHWHAFGITLAIASLAGFAMTLIIDRDWFAPHRRVHLCVGGWAFWWGLLLLLSGFTSHYLALSGFRYDGVAVITGFVSMTVGLLAFRGNAEAVWASVRAMFSGTSGTTRKLLLGLSGLGLIIATGAQSIAQWF